ncbi:MAG: LysE family translocator, partial [Pseudomonadota bacterium]|nr:LysE family translocator [Pseudomonadota bacterium]
MVDPAAALTLVLAALPLMASPGPATLSIAGMSASQGLGPSLRFSFGVVSGSAAAALLVATGVTGALWVLPGAAPVIQAVSLAYLLYLAYR